MILTEISVTRLAATIYARFLGARADIEQRWDVLKKEDQVAALDAIHVAMTYLRTFVDSAEFSDAQSFAFSKSLSEQITTADDARAEIAKSLTEASEVNDEFSRSVEYRRELLDSLADITDGFSRIAEFVRTYTDTAISSDVAYCDISKAFIEIGGPYVEAGYWESGYYTPTGPTLSDAVAIIPNKSITDDSAVTDAFTRVVEFMRGPEETVGVVEAKALAFDQVQAETTTVDDATALAAAPMKEDSVTTADLATMAFAAQILDLVALAESYAHTVIYSRSIAEAATLSDVATLASSLAFLEIGGAYAESYFADDYTAPTGPTVTDSFTYTLA